MYGFLKGFFLAFKRVIRCHPFCGGGLDPVPIFKKKK
jgi:putative component of membrane protein insertase Oxa1/YidC/SpoIIIJ protein YidD